MSGTSMGGMALRTQASIAAPRSHAYPTSRCAVSLATLAVKSVRAAGQLWIAGGSFGGSFDIGRSLPALAASGSAWVVACALVGRVGPPAHRRPRDVDFLEVAYRRDCQARTNRRRLAKLQATPDGGLERAIIPPIPCRPGPAAPCHRRCGGKQGRR